MRGDLHLGHGKRDFLKVERIIPKVIGLFKRIFKRSFFQVKGILVLSPNKKGKPPRPKIKSWVNPKQNTCHKRKHFERESFLEVRKI